MAAATAPPPLYGIVRDLAYDGAELLLAPVGGHAVDLKDRNVVSSVLAAGAGEEVGDASVVLLRHVQIVALGARRAREGDEAFLSLGVVVEHVPAAERVEVSRLGRSTGSEQFGEIVVQPDVAALPVRSKRSMNHAVYAGVCSSGAAYSFNCSGRRARPYRLVM